MNSDNSSRIKYYRWWPVAVAIPILLFTAVEAWQRSLMPEDTYIPATTLPAINAKDYFLKASDSLNADSGSVPPYGTPSSEIGTSISTSFNTYKVYTPAERERIIASNAPAIKVLEEGLKYPYDGASKSANVWNLHYLAADMPLARAIMLAGDDRMAKGDYYGAAKFYLDGVEMGSKIPNGAPLIGMFTGVSCENMERHGLAKLADKLNSAQSSIVAKRLEKADENAQPPFQTLTYEKRFIQGELLGAFAGKDWRGEIPGRSPQDLDKLDKTRLYFESPRTAYGTYTKLMNGCIGVAKLPWPDEIRRGRPVNPFDPANKLILDYNYRQVIFDQYKATVAFRLLELQFVLHAYKLEHGSYPATLKQLSPKILTKVPNDPFSENQPFRYRDEGGKYLLYSIGPDAVDDGGKPIYDPSASYAKRPYVLWSVSEKGDIVAGVNDF